MAKKNPSESFKAEPTEVPFDVKEALDVGAEILRVIEEDINARAKLSSEDYFESVEDKSRSICTTIEKNNKVSERQRAALDNMLNGLRKWTHDD